MIDRLLPLSPSTLAAWVADELAGNGSVLGLPRELAFRPSPADRFRTSVHGHPLDTPFGVAAGPHSQMAQNVVFAWLCGARFVELKTVQTLDQLTIPRPCIDMRDEGYNVEWSQELRVEQSLEQYVSALVLVSALHRRLGFPDERPGVILNVSVGYDLAGLHQPNMQRFLNGVRSCAGLRDRVAAAVARHLPEAVEVPLPDALSDNVTLSTMHGCPPEEIGRIATYLMREWGFHTSVKLNPTLLGAERVRHLLNDRLGWKHVTVPEQAFAHDLEYGEALDLVRELQAEAERCGVDFGVKLSNTLEVEHRGNLFDPRERTMYLSGRPLHPLTVNLAALLAGDFGGRLPISFSGGADAFTAPRLLAAGMRTVTACSDLLRPGGYTRLLQYLESTAEALERTGAADLADLVLRTAEEREGPTFASGLGPEERVHTAAVANLRRYAEELLDNPAFHRDTFDRAGAKTDRRLSLYDCVAAPCTDTCPVDQQVPEYMRLTADRRFAEATAVILADNPLPATLGRACTRACERPCLRSHYDEPVAIREVKRFVMDRSAATAVTSPVGGPTRSWVAVVGGGPCGLAVAAFLAPAGHAVTLFERQPVTGGMVTGTIPGFRAAPAAVEADFARIATLGVELRLGVEVGREVSLEELRRGFDFVVVAAGAQEGLRLGVEGESCAGVLDGLDFLRAVRRGSPPPVGNRVGVIGGGDVAMDCARTARRLGAAEVRILYRRTVAEMPTQREELEAARAEGVELVELVAPRRVKAVDGRLTTLVCARMRLGEADESGRPRPVEVQGADLELELDAVLVAIGQRARLDFLGSTPIERNRGGFIVVDPRTQESSAENLFAGGDAVGKGPATIVKACGDGRRIAAEIRRRVEGTTVSEKAPEPPDVAELLARRARRVPRVAIPELPPADRHGFAEVVDTLSEAEAVREAGRCLSCDRMCSTCVSVCPNRALLTYGCDELHLEVPELELRGGALVPLGTHPFVVRQRLQVALLADLCNECGNCVTFCPTAGKPFRDKPRLFLDRAAFLAEQDNAWRIARRNGVLAAAARFEGETHDLVPGERLRYRSQRVEASFDLTRFSLLDARPVGEWGEGERLDLDRWALMVTLLNNLGRLEPWLPWPPEAESGA